MNRFRHDIEYMDMVKDILDDESFQKIGKIEHHGLTRMDHSIKISYYAYKIAKFLKLSTREVARAGLLHDFFLSSHERKFKDRFISTFTHPKRAVQTAESKFDLSIMEENIIHSHMFPFYFSLPKYAESWIVIFVDKSVGGMEFIQKFGYQLYYMANIYVIALLNFIK